MYVRERLVCQCVAGADCSFSFYCVRSCGGKASLQRFLYFLEPDLQVLAD